MTTHHVHDIRFEVQINLSGQHVIIQSKPMPLQALIITAKGQRYLGFVLRPSSVFVCNAGEDWRMPSLRLGPAIAFSYWPSSWQQEAGATKNGQAKRMAYGNLLLGASRWEVEQVLFWRNLEPPNSQLATGERRTGHTGMRGPSRARPRCPL